MRLQTNTSDQLMATARAKKAIWALLHRHYAVSMRHCIDQNQNDTVIHAKGARPKYIQYKYWTIHGYIYQ